MLRDIIHDNNSIGTESHRLFEEFVEVESIGSGTKVGMYGGGLTQLTPVINYQDGFLLRDVDGREYFDIGGSMASGNLGFRPKVVLDAIIEQSKTVAHAPDYPTISRIALAKKLVAIAPGSMKNNAKVMFDVGGGPMMDLAAKLAYFYNIKVKKRTRNAVLAFYGCYHGRSIYTSLLTGYSNFVDTIPAGQEILKVPYPHCYRCYFEKQYPACDMFCTKYIRTLFERSHAGWRNNDTNDTMVTTVFVEPYQCHGGGIRPPKEFYPELRQICDDFGVLMIEDNIPTFTYSGHWFGCEYWSVTPDVVVIAKSLTAGMWPLGAVIAKKELYESWDEMPDRHYCSYMGHPLGCAAASATIKEVEDRNLLSNAREVGKFFYEGLQDLQDRHPTVGEVTNFGIIQGIEFVRDKGKRTPGLEISQAVVREALNKGLVLLGGLGSYGNRHIIHPSLTVTKEQIVHCLKLMDETITVVEKTEY
jgi:4-aminobutyrate aminotransferase-like enzyme